MVTDDLIEEVDDPMPTPDYYSILCFLSLNRSMILALDSNSVFFSTDRLAHYPILIKVRKEFEELLHHLFGRVVVRVVRAGNLTSTGKWF